MPNSSEKLTKPEVRAVALFSKIDSALFIRNKSDAETGFKLKRVKLSSDGLGTSILYADGLYFDDKTKGPKNFKELWPDFVWGGHFIEVKDVIAKSEWAGFHLFFNDNLRFLLLRMKHSALGDRLRRHRFEELSKQEQDLVERDLQKNTESNPNPAARYYVRWREIIETVPSPSTNFKLETIEVNGTALPVRIVSGLEHLDESRLYLLDDEMMGAGVALAHFLVFPWENLDAWI